MGDGVTIATTRGSWLLAACLALGGLQCTGTVVEEPICVPGETVQCACPDGRTGAKACKSDGSGWECCVCTGPCPGLDDDDAWPPLDDDDIDMDDDWDGDDDVDDDDTGDDDMDDDDTPWDDDEADEGGLW
jgi:hypothetical protein